MVRYANRSRMAIRVPDGSTPRPWVHGARTHHFPRFASRTLRRAAAASSWQGYDQRPAHPCAVPRIGETQVGERQEGDRWAGRAIGAVPRQTRFVRRLLLVRAAPVSDN